MALNSDLGFNQCFDLLQEPHVNLGDFMDFTQGNTHLHGIVQNKDAIPRGVLQFVKNDGLISQPFAIST